MSPSSFPVKRGRPKKETLKEDPIKATLIFHLNRQADNQIIINRGGRGSSKSFSIAQLLVEYFFTIPDIRIMILRKTQPSLRISVIPLINSIIDSYGMGNRVFEVKQDRNIFSPVNALIHFGGMDDPEKVKSSDWNIIFLEEATEFSYEDYIGCKMLLRSPICGNIRNKIFMSFNPVDEYHWIKEKVISNASEDYCEIHSTYRHNPFLSDDYVNTIKALELQDRNFYRIFSQGEWGRLEHVIYSNWEKVRLLPDGPHTFWGLDFGYNSPSALVKITMEAKNIGVEEKLYQTGLTNSALISKLNSIIPEEDRGSQIIVADCAEPDRIQEINESGFWCVPAIKDVSPGIDFLKSCKIRVTEGSDNFIKEISGYSYRTDRNDRVLDEPVKAFDHCMDAMRYAVFTYHKEGRDNSGSFIKTL